MKSNQPVSKTFIIFIVAAILIWALINMSKEYTSVVEYKVDYVDFPTNKTLQKDPSKNIKLLLKGSGFKLFSANVFNNSLLIKADALSRKSKNDFYILTTNKSVEIQGQLASGVTLVDVLKDTIFFKLGSLITKKVPIKLASSISFKKGFNLTETPLLTPSHIDISAPELQLDTINYIFTAVLNLSDVSEDFSSEVLLNIPDGFKTESKSVTVSGNVDRFTEGKIELPFQVINFEDNTSLTTFPKTVELTYKVGLKNFNKITSESFKVVCDYKESLNKNLEYLIPRVTVSPSEVISYTLEPNKIEFLIQK